MLSSYNDFVFLGPRKSRQTGETDDRTTDCSTERSGADGCLNKFLWFKESKIGWGGTSNKKLDLMGSYDF